MRLLNLNTLELREFIDAERPPYVILSHTWGAEEISLQELKLPVSNASYLSTKEGYVKILNFCQKGKRMGLSGDGSILAVSIRRVALSFRKLSILCLE
jgi:hypothetical protein